MTMQGGACWEVAQSMVKRGYQPQNMLTGKIMGRVALNCATERKRMRTDIKIECYGWQPDSEKALKFKTHCETCSVKVECWSDSTPENQSYALLKYNPAIILKITNSDSLPEVATP